METQFQKAINSMSRAAVGVFPSMPAAFLSVEEGHMSAKARLDLRQERFAQGSCSSTQHGPTQGDMQLVRRLKKTSGITKAEAEKVEFISPGRDLPFPGKTVFSSKVGGNTERGGRPIEEAVKKMRHGRTGQERELDR